ncbi:methyltransferase [Streptomyces sp. MB09-01]|uniref:methyltransferase n=1 Tax=Streptomyces sp. MB09-01 TaxID=3028666 RepID=UPI0029BBBE25|nr:methyltransferase [Streptomyces sp. MB09-01]MDX3537516.1 methyltransferase [Streptomyces sp. MB09-01]
MSQQTKDGVLRTLRDIIVGPTRFATIATIFELGIAAQLKTAGEEGMNAAQLAAVTATTAHNIEQLLQLAVKEGLVARSESGQYTSAGLALLDDGDLARITPWIGLVKEVCLRQVYHLTESVRSGEIVGLKELYGVEGNFYSNMLNLPSLHETWAKAMAQVTALADPWLFGRLDFPRGARVLDVAGNTGQGAVLAHRHHPDKDLHITCFDLPEKEGAALASFKEAGLEERCAFIGGDAFAAVPAGFDVITIKHFLDMWDRQNAVRILRNAHEALPAGGILYAMHLVYPEQGGGGVEEFFPAYFLGCTMAQGGPQKTAAYVAWIEEAGFTVTSVTEQDTTAFPADTIPAHSVICASKPA